MTNSGLSDLLRAAFGSVDKMLSGKNFPQNVCALRMVVEKLLRDSIHEMKNMNGLTTFLDNVSTVWIDNLIKPVFYVMQFIRAEREGDWPLHLDAVSKMLPYFFAAGHQNYARYGLYYLHDMKKLPVPILEKFMRGEHITRHQKGLWNGIWTYMFIEKTFGKGPGGLIGLTLKPKVVKKWAYGLKTCIEINKDLDQMRKASAEKDQLKQRGRKGPHKI